MGTASLGIVGAVLGVGAIIVVPIMGFVGGLIQGLIIAVVYNFLAPRIGDVKLRFKEDNPTPPYYTHNKPFFPVAFLFLRKR